MSTEELTAASLLARIEAEGVRRVCNAYRKPPIPSRILQELTTLPDASLALDFVAAYPLSPSHLLETLAQSSPPSSALALLATNPRTPPHLLTQFATHEDPAVRAQAASHRQLPSRELVVLTEDPDPAVRRALAANPALRLPHQAALVADADPAVRLRLAGQAGLPAPVALVLGADDCAVVRLHTLATATVETELLESWAASDEEDGQLALLQRRNLPAEICHALVRSPHASVRRQARTDLDLDDVDLLYLITRGETEERAWVAARPLLLRPLQSLLARDAEESVRLALAANPVLEEVVARYFVGLAEASVCAALAANPAVSADLIEELAATREPAVLVALAYREDLDPKLATFLLHHSPDFRRHWAIQGRTSPELEVETARILFADALPTVRVLAVTACPNWRRADLYDLARDPAAAVCRAALRHPNAPDELLEDYATDSDPAVAAVARALQAERAARPRPISPPTPAPVAARKSAQTAIDASSARSSLSAPRSVRLAAPTPSRPAAPDIFHKLKRIFWQ